MTDLAFTPTGRPVRRFTLAIAAMAVLATLVWWTGALHPRLQVAAWSSTFDERTRTGVAIVEVENLTPLPVRIVGVGGDRDVIVTDAGPAHGDDAPRGTTAVAMAPHATVKLAVAFRFPCPGWSPPDGHHGLRLDVRTASGITRHLVRERGLDIASFPCPAG